MADDIDRAAYHGALGRRAALTQVRDMIDEGTSLRELRETISIMIELNRDAVERLKEKHDDLLDQ